MKFIFVDENRRASWNDFVQSCPNGSILQSYEWGLVKSRTWRPFYTAVVDEQENFLAAALILKRKLPFFSQSVFYCPRGPVFKTVNGNLTAFLFHSIEELARKESGFVFRCDPEIPESDMAFTSLLYEGGLRYNSDNIQPRGTIVLDIRPDEDALLKSFHHKTRYNIKLAEKKGVMVEERNSQDGVDLFYDLFEITSARDRFMILKKNYFKRFHAVLSENNHCSLFIASFDNKPISAILLTVFGTRMVYLYGASSNELRQVMPNHLIHWRAIQWAKKRGVEFYDLWGIPTHPDEHSPLGGVYRFKKGFCDTETKWIGTYELVFNSFWYFVFEKGARWFKAGIRFLKTGKIRTSLEE